jgi:hypothetical protein
MSLLVNGLTDLDDFLPFLWDQGMAQRNKAVAPEKVFCRSLEEKK